MPPSFPELYSQELMQRREVKQLREQCAALRFDAKTTTDRSEAKELRQQAKTLTLQAYELRESAKRTRQDVLQGLEASAADLTRRMPPEFASWGVMKTRGYAKLLAFLVAQSQRVHPKLPLACRAFDLLQAHQQWSAEQANRLSGLSKNPKTLP